VRDSLWRCCSDQVHDFPRHIHSWYNPVTGRVTCLVWDVTKYPPREMCNFAGALWVVLKWYAQVIRQSRTCVCVCATCRRCNWIVFYPTDAGVHVVCECNVLVLYIRIILSDNRGRARSAYDKIIFPTIVDIHAVCVCNLSTMYTQCVCIRIN